MTKGSENPFPHILIEEVATDGSATPTPAADFRHMFVGEDGLFHLKDSSGTVTTPGQGALTDPMTTRGDIIVRNASNATARLAIGSSGKVLSSDGTDVSWQTPTSAVHSAHSARVHRSTGNVALGNNTFTVITWDVEDWDTDSMHDTGSNTSRLVVPSITGVTTGLWAITAKGYSNATSNRTDILFKVNANGSPASGTQIGVTVGGPIASSGVGPVVAYEEWVMSAGDYVECFFRSVGGSFSLLFDSATNPSFSMSFLGKVT